MSIATDIVWPTYPKIETYFERDSETFKVTETIRCPEFALVDRWLVTEKIDGTNVRVLWDGERVSFGGRSNNAQMPTFLLSHLQDTFTAEKMSETFPDADRVVLFGEGFGPKIQKSGGNYGDSVNFRLFDVRVGNWWLNWFDGVADVAGKLGIEPAPTLGVDLSFGESLAWVEAPSSVAALQGGNTAFVQEGIVARTEPLLFTRRGERVMWKLKGRDWRGGKL